MTEAVQAIKFLIARTALDIGERDAWCRLAIAFKHTFGEPGFPDWLLLSQGAPNFKSDADCRRTWDGIDAQWRANPLTLATYFAEARQLGWRPAPKNSGQTMPIGQGPPKGGDAAAFVIQLAEDAQDEFWIDREGKPHVTFITHSPDGQVVRRHAPVSDPTYRKVLSDRYHRAAVTKVLPSEQANQAIGLLEFKASESGQQHEAALRVAELDGVIYVDLGTPTGGAIEIDKNDWRVISEPPVRFVRGSRGALPVPEPDGSLADFRRHFNLSKPDLQLAIGFMVGSFNVGGPYPILLTDGQQGSGKSCINDKIVGLIDPPNQFKSARMSFNPKEQDLHLSALGVHVMYFDNVSSFSAEAADALCRLSTGGGSGARKLYTDDQFHRVVVTRPMIMTCIGTPSARPDLLSRSLQITAIPFEGRTRTEKSVMQAFDEDRPKMFGFLLTCVSAALRNRASIEKAVEQGEIGLPRMADFAQFVEGASELLELPRGGFSALVGSKQKQVQTDAALGSPVGAALGNFFKANCGKELAGTASEVLGLLRPPGADGARWPSPNGFRRSIQRMAVGLRNMGIEWEISEPSGHENVTKFRFWATGELSVGDAPDPF